VNKWPEDKSQFMYWISSISLWSV